MATIVGKNPALIRRNDCIKCASIIEYTMSEIQTHQSRDYTGGTDIDHYIPCPCCGHRIIVKGY